MSSFLDQSLFSCQRFYFNKKVNILQVCHLITMACVEWTWGGLLTTCKSLHQKYGPDIEIPSVYDPDVLQVFDNSQVHENVFRFVTYILWLARQPDAYEKYLQVKLNRTDLWTKCVFQLCQL